MNTDKNNYNNYKNTNKFEYNVISLLQKTPFIRKRQLIESLRTEFKKTRGYSIENIQKKLYDMEHKGILLVISPKNFQKFGIKDEDKRSRYVTLKKTEEIASHLDSVIGNISSDNSIKQKMALRELERYEKYCLLNPRQLDILIAQLDTEDIDFIDNILRIVYTYIDKKDIEPYDSPKTIEMLRNLLNKYPKPLLHRNKNLRTHFIYLLGHYNDYAVVERLKKDAEELDNLHEMRDYESNYTANIIEDHREELYEFEEKLRLEGKEEPAQFIAQTRVTAMIHLGMYDNPLKQNIADVEGF
ncbi:hypothetical protein [Methanolobus sp. WCC5]|uniref:hypothetical protein n=1 Tax=Methanolobus sp. WCC5 TaxID=3125785 RepID=UPI00324CF1BA